LKFNKLILEIAYRKISKVLDVQHDSSYHYLYGYYKRRDFVDIDRKDKDKYINTFVSKAIADEITNNVIQHTLYEEEDWRNPFGVLPKSFSQRPKQGSGFLVADNHVVTNYHVIDGAKNIKLLGVEGDFTTEHQASVKAVDVQNDLALLQIESKLIKLSKVPYRFKSSVNTRVGVNAYAMGYPLSNVMGNEVKITDGIINSNSGFKGSLSLYQFSASVQPGNSGGPLFNSQGDVIGIVTAKLKSEETESISYAVKADNLMLFLNQAGIEFLAEEDDSETIELTELVERNSSFVYLIKTE